MTGMRTTLVGAFVIVGLGLFAGGLFLIGDRRLLFTEQFEINSTFGKVTGLQVGARVRLAGLDAGEVLEILPPSNPSDSFRVRMRIRSDLRHLVRADSVPAIQTDGIVGNAFIQVPVGTESSPPVSDGDTLRGMDPIEFADLIQEGRKTFQVVAVEVSDLRGDVSTAIKALTGTAETATSVIDNVGRNVEELTEASAAAMRDARSTITEAQMVMADIRSGRGTIGRLVTDDALYERVASATQDVAESMRNVRDMTERTRELVTSFAAHDGSAQQIATSLRNALADVQEATADLAEGTEALKRNFLFRGFFRNRGFYDLDSVSREAYQAGALERDRTRIRIWIAADGLFVRDIASGEERLTDDGRRRLDSAMADLVRYPRDSPLVVEGYAEGAAGEPAYLESIDRAEIVRAYLLSRFRRQATLTDIMPMGSEATGSPRGNNRWSGVALALFVRNDALASVRQTAPAAPVGASQGGISKP
jgi:phospholipid/cholesterol/gamma-HCH transport system substrate-binding protein